MPRAVRPWKTGVWFVCRRYDTLADAEAGARHLNRRGPWQARAVPWKPGDYPGAPWRAPAVERNQSAAPPPAKPRRATTTRAATC